MSAFDKMTSMAGNCVDNKIYGREVSAFLAALLIRWTVAFHSYSGEKTPPMYGDYEAQRHWMEITFNLPLSDWYRNTTDNNLMYWGLDYPPLTAYHSYICGFVASWILPDSIELRYSRGYESYEHKLFMRLTVFIVDILIFFPAIFYFFIADKRPSKPRDPFYSKWVYLFLALTYPGLILVDYAHFQYNCVSLGLYVASVAFLKRRKNIPASIFFCLALNYKQMELYHALPYFVFFLGRYVEQWRGGVRLKAGRNLFLLAFTVVATFVVIWYPFIVRPNSFIHVIGRIFPVDRGIFEDKVSNFWCVFNVIYKLRNIIDNNDMFQLSSLITLSVAAPSLFDLLRYPRYEKFVLSSINVALTFFLFSYQVHEKSILLVAIPAMLYYPANMVAVFWFLLISTFSMLPLFVKDSISLPFISLSLMYYLIFVSFVNAKLIHRKTKWDKISYLQFPTYDLKTVAFYISFLGCIVLSLVSWLLTPPTRYPDLWPLAVSFYSFCHFCGFLCYFYYKQFMTVRVENDTSTAPLKKR